jgi:hypothetical protein
MKKTRSKKSRDTAPLRLLKICIYKKEKGKTENVENFIDIDLWLIAK